MSTQIVALSSAWHRVKGLRIVACAVAAAALAAPVATSTLPAAADANLADCPVWISYSDSTGKPQNFQCFRRPGETELKLVHSAPGLEWVVKVCFRPKLSKASYKSMKFSWFANKGDARWTDVNLGPGISQPDGAGDYCKDFTNVPGNTYVDWYHLVPAPAAASQPAPAPAQATTSRAASTTTALPLVVATTPQEHKSDTTRINFKQQQHPNSAIWRVSDIRFEFTAAKIEQCKAAVQCHQTASTIWFINSGKKSDVHIVNRRQPVASINTFAGTIPEMKPKDQICVQSQVNAYRLQTTTAGKLCIELQATGGWNRI